MSRNQSIYAVMVVIAVMVVAFFVGSLTVSAATITVNSNNGNDDGGVDGECNFGEAVVSINTGGDYGDCVADVTNLNDCKKLINHTIKKWGSLDVLVCNVGSGKSVLPGNESYSEWKKIFDLNFFATTNIIENAKKYLKSNGLSILSIILVQIEFLRSEALQ